jgi:hypothetical protein
LRARFCWSARLVPTGIGRRRGGTPSLRTTLAAAMRVSVGLPAPARGDPEELAATLRELARLDPVELGLQAVLERIVQAAATGCGSTGGGGLLLLAPTPSSATPSRRAGPDATGRHPGPAG